MISTDGDGTATVKYKNGKIVVVAGSQDQLTVGPNSVDVATNLNVANDLVVSGDLSAAAGGMVKSYTAYSYRVLQNTKPIMSSSQLTVSGTANDGLTFYYTKFPLRNAGSIVGISLVSEDGTIKSGSLTATAMINGSLLAARLPMTTGSIGSVSFAKDTYTFAANSYLQIQLSASTTYLNDLDITSCSFACTVDVEY